MSFKNSFLISSSLSFLCLLGIRRTKPFKRQTLNKHMYTIITLASLAVSFVFVLYILASIGQYGKNATILERICVYTYLAFIVVTSGLYVTHLVTHTPPGENQAFSGLTGSTTREDDPTEFVLNPNSGVYSEQKLNKLQCPVGCPGNCGQVH